MERCTSFSAVSYSVKASSPSEVLLTAACASSLNEQKIMQLSRFGKACTLQAMHSHDNAFHKEAHVSFVA